MIYNKIFNTRPYIIHSPTDSEMLSKIKSIQEKESSHFTKPPDLDIITYNNKFEHCLLEKCMQLVNLPHNVLGRGLVWQNKLKLNLICEFLETSKSKYVLSIDGYDALIVRDISNIIEEFSKLNVKLLFNATNVIWPRVPKIFSCDNIFKKTNTNKFVHLNAGVWIGERSFCLDFFSEAKNQINVFNGLDYSEQILVKLAAEKFQDYSVDCRSEFFQIYHAFYPENSVIMLE